MLRASGSPAAVSNLPAWTILFAREPEPDLDLDETSTDMDETGHPDDGGDGPHGSGDDNKHKLLKLVALAVLAGAGLYVAMDPSILIGPPEEPPSVPAPASPKAAQAPAAVPQATAPATQAAPPAPMAPTPQAPGSVPAPANAPQPMAAAPAQQTTPTMPPVAAPPQPKTTIPATASVPAPAMPSAAPPKPAPAAATGFSPLFSEGQQVLVLADPAKPTGPVSLMADANGSRPGPTVAPNATATVQDGELRSNGWIYAIRTTQGATGWVSEKQLQAK